METRKGHSTVGLILAVYRSFDGKMEVELHKSNKTVCYKTKCKSISRQEAKKKKKPPKKPQVKNKINGIFVHNNLNQIF